MKNLYLLRRLGTNATTFSMLEDAANSRGIKVKEINWEGFDFSNVPTLTKDDGMYAISFGPLKRIEKVLLNSEVSTFYSHYMHGIIKPDNVVGTNLIHQKVGLQIIPTIFALSTDKELLKKYAEALGGFPIIVKSAGGSHGRGVIKVDSLDSLASICDYLFTLDHDFVLRSFIPHKKQGRLIVVGDEVVAAHQNYAALDFRSNVGPNELRKREVVQYDNDICEMAVKAVHAMNVEFGGVDILFDEKTDTPYIAEVNFPCFFPTTQMLTGIDIAGKMIDHLIEKSKK